MWQPEEETHTTKMIFIHTNGANTEHPAGHTGKIFWMTDDLRTATGRTYTCIWELILAKSTNKKHAFFHKQIRLFSVYLRTCSFLTCGIQQRLRCLQTEIFLNEHQHHPQENIRFGNPQNNDSPTPNVTEHVKQVLISKKSFFLSS